MTKQRMFVGDTVITKYMSFAQSNDRRDSLAKSVYSLLFHWLFDTINATISAPTDAVWGIIGVLDIYGFENFSDVNSFEQLLINYANEKLQNHFNQHVFLMEQQEYVNYARVRLYI